MSDLSNSINNMHDKMILAVTNIMYVALLLLLALIIDVIVRFIITKGLKKVGVPTAMSKLPVVENPQQGKDILRTIGTVVYYLIFILFLPSILDVLGKIGRASCRERV